MPRLLAALEGKLRTDFACLALRQRTLGPGSDASTYTYAASAPGIVVMETGDRHATLLVRAEHWDAKPPVADEVWEDSDELPWQTVPSGGPVNFVGYEDELPGAGLVLDGLERARVQVLAAGRHRYDYCGGEEKLSPERWLLRFWPDAEGRDAMAGPPRRIAANQRHELPPWWAALHAWRWTGWSSALNGVRAFDEIEQAIGRIGRPFAADDLLPLFGPWGTERERDGPYGWTSPCDRSLSQSPDVPGVQYALDRLSELAETTGLAALQTFGDMLECLERVGLLVRCHPRLEGRLVPNPAPRPIWDVVPCTDAARWEMRLQAMRAEHSVLEDELKHLVRWAEGGVLRATPRAVAIRLSRSPVDVLGGLRLLDHLSRGEFLAEVVELEADTVLELRRDRLTSPG